MKWPEWEHNGGNIPKAVNECFACEIAGIRFHKKYKQIKTYDDYNNSKISFRCEDCPLKWPNNKICFDADNIFKIIESSKDHDALLMLKAAIIIANLKRNGKKKKYTTYNKEPGNEH